MKGVPVLKLFKNESFSTKWSKPLKKDVELLHIDKILKAQIKEKFNSSLKLYIVDAGSCSGCELELQALFNPFYKLQALGVEVVYEIEKADVLIVSGLITENMYVELRTFYESFKAPKHLITLGDCPVFQAPFRDTFAIRTKGSNYFPSVHHIAGCPPSPKEILRGVVRFIKKYKSE
jgi:Ni,Fe-hydrogenase III small subunit